MGEETRYREISTLIAIIALIVLLVMTTRAMEMLESAHVVNDICMIESNTIDEYEDCVELYKSRKW